MSEKTPPDPNRDRVTVFISRSGPDDGRPDRPADDVKAIDISLDTALRILPDLRDVLTQPPLPARPDDSG